MTLPAYIVAFVAAVAVVFAGIAFGEMRRALESNESTMRVLLVAVNGLEAKLTDAIRETRDSADAAAAQATRVVEAFEKMQEGPAVETAPGREARFAAFGRISAAREFFARAEADSFEAVAHPAPGVNGG